MKIGAWSFNDIVAMGFDKARIKFTAIWLFVILLLSLASNMLVNTLLNTGIGGNGLGIKVVDIVTIVVTALLGLYVSLGITASLKVKTKVKSFAALVKPLYLKQLWVIILALLTIVVGLAIAYGVGQISRIPTAGPILMALLAIPFVLCFAYLAVFAVITVKLSTAAVVENAKASVKDIIVELLGITKNNFAKITFNVFLLIIPILITLLSIVVILGLGYIGYILFGWALTSCYSILSLCMQGEFNTIYILETLSGLAIVSFAASYIINVGLAGLYSIYLDAAK